MIFFFFAAFKDRLAQAAQDKGKTSVSLVHLPAWDFKLLAYLTVKAARSFHQFDGGGIFSLKILWM